MLDWSGAGPGHERRLWTAEVEQGRLVRLRNGRTRDEVTADLLMLVRETRRRAERVLVGLDFAFGAPAWFLERAGWRSATEWWRAMTPATVARVLAAPSAPFWGRPPTRQRPAMLDADGPTPPWRATERSLRGIARPFSVFQLVGAGAVGVGSLRGLATLVALQDAGAVVWPFDEDPGGPGVVVAEVWPRLAMRHLTKSDPAARRAALARIGSVVSCAPPDQARAVESDDAFDALAAAAWLWAHRARLGRLPTDSCVDERREGRILGARTPTLLAEPWPATTTVSEADG